MGLPSPAAAAPSTGGPPFVLYDSIANLFFCLPLVNGAEWSPDPHDAHQFVTLERAKGGAVVWLEIHQINLEVLTFDDACTIHETLTA